MYYCGIVLCVRRAGFFVAVAVRIAVDGHDDGGEGEVVNEGSEQIAMAIKGADCKKRPAKSRSRRPPLSSLRRRSSPPPRPLTENRCASAAAAAAMITVVKLT